MGPYETISDRLEVFVRMSIPYSLLCFLFLLSVVSVPYPLSALLHAPLLLIAIYYWSIYRPALLPSWLVFGIGLVLDLLTGLPFLGFNAVLFLLCRLAVIDQRRFLTGQTFSVIWLGFCLLSVLFHLLQWMMFSALSMQIVPVSDFTSPLILGVFVFPLICLFLHLSHKALPPPIVRAKSRLGSQKSNMVL